MALSPSVNEFAPAAPVLGSLWPLGVGMVVGLAPAALLCIVAIAVSRAPLRRRETAQLLLDIVAASFKQGRRPKETIVAAARTLDPELADAFHSIAAALDHGQSLSNALDASGLRLPPGFKSLIGMGERTGRLREILPAAERILRDSQRLNRNAAAAVIGLAFVVAPFALMMLAVLRVYVFPKFLAIMEDMGTETVPALATWAFSPDSQWLSIHLLLMLGIWAAVMAYVAVARGYWSGLLPDAAAMLIPWRRKRMQRDFSTALAVLLDAGLGEEEAVRLAAEALGNRAFQDRAALIIENLAQGRPLPDAVEPLDPDGQFRWRLRNGGDRPGRFTRALAGWQESLEARAFLQQQAATHGLAAFLVLWNGIVVGGVGVCIFQFMVNVLNTQLLW